MILTIWGLRNELLCCDSTLETFLDELDKHEPSQTRDVHVEDVIKSITKLSMLDSEGLFDTMLDLVDRQSSVTRPFYLKGFIHQDVELVVNKLNAVDRLYFLEGYLNMSKEMLRYAPETLNYYSSRAETLFPSVLEMIKKIRDKRNTPSGLEDLSKIKGRC